MHCKCDQCDHTFATVMTLEKHEKTEQKMKLVHLSRCLCCTKPINKLQMCTVLQHSQCDHVIAIIKTLKKHENLIHCLTVLLLHATCTSALFQSTGLSDQTGMCLNALHPPTHLPTTNVWPGGTLHVARFRGCQKWHFQSPKRKSETTFIDQLPPLNLKKITSGMHFRNSKVFFWPFYLFGIFWSVKRPKTKSAILASKESSNQKMQENKLALKFNFTLESTCLESF